jgi:hypothetical protein
MVSNLSKVTDLNKWPGHDSDPQLFVKNTHELPRVMFHTCNSSTQEAEAGGSLA